MKQGILLLPRFLRNVFPYILLFWTSLPLTAQHNWTFDVHDYEYNMQVDAVVLFESTELEAGTLGAFVGDECRNFVDGLVGPLGNIIYPLRVWSNSTGSEEISFRYFSPTDNKVYHITEKIDFSSEAYIGDALNPVQFNIVKNVAPVADCPDYSGVVGDPGLLLFDFCAIFSDVNADPLTFDAVNSIGSTISWIDDCNLSFQAASSGISTLEISASDGEFSATCSYSFNVEETNHPPVIENPVGLVRLSEGFGTHEIDLDNVFSDEDNDPLSYSAQSSDISVASVSILGSTLTVNELGAGNALIKISASDTKASVSSEFDLVVLSLNTPLPWNVSPQNYQYNGQIEAVVSVNGSELTSGFVGAFVGDECRGIAEGTLFEPTGRTIFTLVCYSDISEGEFMTFRYYHPLDNEIYTLDETVEFVSDMKLGNAVAPYVFSFNSGNHLPSVLNPVDDLVLNEHFDTHSFNIVTVFTDEDGDDLFYSVKSSDETVLTASVDVDGNLQITEQGIGEANIILSASDGRLSIDDFFLITISDVNDSPVLTNPIDDLSFNEGFRSRSLDISDVFSDPEQNELSYTCTSSDTSVITLYISGSDLVLREAGIGTTTLELCAFDSENTSCDEFVIEVIEVNDPPEANCDLLEDTTLIIGFGNFELEDICSFFVDPEGDLMSFSANSDNPSVVSVSLDGCSLLLTEQGLGSAKISICANDGIRETCCSVNVKIIDENELIIVHADSIISYTDTISICSDPETLEIKIISDISWNANVYTEWLNPEIVNDSLLHISCAENTSGEWRMGLVKVIDTQEHEALFYVYQDEDCSSSVWKLQPGNFKVYPNPSNGVVYLQFDSKQSVKWNKLEVLSSDGKPRLVSAIYPTVTPVISVSLTGLTPGFYLLKITSQNGDLAVHRVIIN